MLGAIIGDIVGSRFEWDNYKGTDFKFITRSCCFTDDTVCTVAVAEWALTHFQGDLVSIMRKWGSKYRNAGYGPLFSRWLDATTPRPYRSYGNGSAMRVSAVAWRCKDIESVLKYAKQSAAITHDHPEGIKGAQAVAAAIYFARTGKSKAFIKEYIEKTFGYDLSKRCNEIRPTYKFDVTCQGSVPQAITAFLESTDFENAIRLAVSLGGDSDTIAAIAGSIAEAFYQGIPEDIIFQALQFLPEEMLDILRRI